MILCGSFLSKFSILLFAGIGSRPGERSLASVVKSLRQTQVLDPRHNIVGCVDIGHFVLISVEDLVLAVRTVFLVDMQGCTCMRLPGCFFIGQFKVS